MNWPAIIAVPRGVHNNARARLLGAAAAWTELGDPDEAQACENAADALTDAQIESDADPCSRCHGPPLTRTKR